MLKYNCKVFLFDASWFYSEDINALACGRLLHDCFLCLGKASFKRRILHAPNAIQTIDN